MSLATRIATARQELKRVGEFKYVVVNSDHRVPETVNHVRSIIAAEKQRVDRILEHSHSAATRYYALQILENDHHYYSCLLKP
jgi:guanylate kinase